MNKKKLLPLQMECILLFQSNPSMAVSMEEIERELGREKEELEAALQILIQQGIIQKIDDISYPAFCYKEPKMIMK